MEMSNALDKGEDVRSHETKRGIIYASTLLAGERLYLFICALEATMRWPLGAWPGGGRFLVPLCRKVKKEPNGKWEITYLRSCSRLMNVSMFSNSDSEMMTRYDVTHVDPEDRSRVIAEAEVWINVGSLERGRVV